MKAQKEKLRVIIFTQHHRIKGEVHLYENSRLTDILNADTGTKDFLPVTNAEVHDLRTGSSQHVSFLSVNRSLIEIVIEDDEVVALAKAKDLIAKRRFGEAIPFAQRAIKAAPDNAECQYILGFCLAKIGENKAAKECFEKCLQCKPDAEISHKATEMLRAI